MQCGSHMKSLFYMMEEGDRKENLLYSKGRFPLKEYFSVDSILSILKSVIEWNFKGIF